MENKQDFCFDCEVFKNYEGKAKSFALGFYCPLKNSFVMRDNFACEWIVGDNLPF